MSLLLSALMLATVVVPGCASEQEAYDGFETPALSGIWSAKRFLPGAVEMQTAIVRAGKSAVSITLHPGDQLADEKGTELERAELSESPDLVSSEGSLYSYSFSMFLPRDFPIVPTRLVVAQWKQYCESGNCRPDNPIVALRYASGQLRITLQVGPAKTTLYRHKGEIRNRWLDLRFLMRFSRTGNGMVTAWIDGNKVVDYTGITAYSEACGYPPNGRFYFKMGLYRDRLSQPMTIYFDEYRKRLISMQ